MFYLNHVSPEVTHLMASVSIEQKPVNLFTVQTIW